MPKHKTASVEKAFKELREAWFRWVLYRDAAERQWEDAEEGRRREHRNITLKKHYDAETQAIINGDQEVPVAPRSANEVMI